MRFNRSILSEAGGFSPQWKVNAGSTAKAVTLISTAGQNTLYLCNISAPVQLSGDMHRIIQQKHQDTIKYRKCIYCSKRVPSISRCLLPTLGVYGGVTYVRKNTVHDGFF
jgi:hypothetical protein